MEIRLIHITDNDLQSIITDAYKDGYIKAQKEWLAEKEEAEGKEPKFGEIIRGAKELSRYLHYKDYWKGSLSTLNKVAYQLLAEGDRQGHGLIFRKTYIDHCFQTGFLFITPIKKNKV